MTFLLLNATGKIGSEAVRQLIAKGYRPRLGVRDKKKARHLFGDDVDLATANIEVREEPMKRVYVDGKPVGDLFR